MFAGVQPLQECHVTLGRQMKLCHGIMASLRPRATHIPTEVVTAIGRYVHDQRSLFFLATLFFIPELQIGAYRQMHEMAFDVAAAAGNIPLLDRLLNYSNLTGLPPGYSYLLVCDAAARGDVPVLQWWRDSGLKLPYLEWSQPCEPLHQAARNGHVQVLQWFKDIGWLFEESAFSYVVDDACSGGHVAALQWWKDHSGVPFRYYNALSIAITKRHLPVLQWWLDNGLSIHNSLLNYVDSPTVLDWWRRSGLEMPCGEAIDHASISGNVSVLNWWKSSGLLLTYTSKAMDGASQNGHVACLQWWRDSGLELCYSSMHLWDMPVDVIEWWSNCGLPIKLRMFKLRWEVHDLDVQSKEKAVKLFYILWQNRRPVVVDRARV